MITIQSSHAAIFNGHCRDRSPELIPSQSGCAGPVPEIIETALKLRGHTVKWSLVPWARTMLEAKSGEVDMIPRHSMTPERETFLNAISYGYKVRQVYFIIAPGKTFEINNYIDLKKYTIGALRESFYSEKFNSASDLNKKFFLDTPQLIKMLTLGRIDVAITSSAHDIAQFRSIPGVREAVYIDRFYNGRYISVPKKSPMAQYYPAIEEEINKMKGSGEIRRIFVKYGIKAPVQK